VAVKKICIVNCFLVFGTLQKMQQGQHNARQGTHGKPEVLLVLDRASAAFISHPAKVSFPLSWDVRLGWDSKCTAVQGTFWEHWFAAVRWSTC
jgi:hypothetical protein